MPDVYDEVRDERVRAHAKHAETSMEQTAIDDLFRFTILVEEVGEVGKEFNEARHEHRPVDLTRLRKELIQTAAMAAAWADAIVVPVAEPLLLENFYDACPNCDAAVFIWKRVCFSPDPHNEYLCRSCGWKGRTPVFKERPVIS